MHAPKIPFYVQQLKWNLFEKQQPNITALDPALPLFITAAPQDKLDPTDAEFVDVYHSNAFVQGQIERCGSVDFYMNGGIGID